VVKVANRAVLLRIGARRGEFVYMVGEVPCSCKKLSQAREDFSRYTVVDRCHRHKIDHAETMVKSGPV
jgi:hypothetical protein